MGRGRSELAHLIVDCAPVNYLGRLDIIIRPTVTFKARQDTYTSKHSANAYLTRYLGRLQHPLVFLRITALHTHEAHHRRRGYCNRRQLHES